MIPSGTSLLRRLPTFLLALAVALSAAFTLGAVAAHATTHGEVAVTDAGPNRLDLWTNGPSGHVWERTLTVSGSSSSWSDWTDMGAPSVGVASEPEVIHIPDNSPATQHGKYFMFVRGGDNAMWMKVYTPGSGWGAWASQGGTYSAGFHAAYSSGGDWIDVVGRDAGNNMTWRVMNQGTWTINSGANANLTFTPAVLDWTPSGQAPRADVFAVGSTDNSIWTSTNQNLQWSSWAGMNGNATSAPSAAFGDSTSRVAVRGYDSVTAFVNTNTGGGWQGWANLGGSLSTGPTVHYWPMGDGRPRWWVVARDGDDTPNNGGRPGQVIMDEKVDSANWTGWVGLTITPETYVYNVSTQYGGADGQINTDAEVAAVVNEIRGATPQVAAGLLDGIRPGAERDRVKAALTASDTEATVAVTSDGADRLDLWTGAGTSIFQRTWASGQGWSQWWNLGAPSTGVNSAPDVVRTPDGRYRIFVIDINGDLWMRMYYPPGSSGPTEGWAAWEKVPGTVGPYVGGVQAAYSNNGDWVDVVTRKKTTNQLVWQHWNNGAGWQPADARGDGQLSGTPSLADWTKPGQTASQLDVFAKGDGDSVFTSTNQNLAWTAWGNMNGQATSPVDAAVGDGRVVLTLRGVDNTSAYGSTYLPDSGWGAWTNLGGNLSSGPTIAYWPDESNGARWEVVARDGGALSSGRPGQIVRLERTGNGPTWGAWTGISSIPGTDYYGASAQFGGDDGIISTQAEIDAAVQAIRAADPMAADSLLAGIAPAQRDAVWRAAFPTSWQYGGDDHSVTTSAEVDAVVGALDATTDDGAARALLAGLSKDNAKRVDVRLKARVNDGDIIRDISDSRAYAYSGGIVQYIPNGFAGPANIDLSTAKRVTHAVLTSWTMGPDAQYPTSWRYGGADHRVTTDDEVAAVIGAYAADPSDAAVAALLDGLEPTDRGRVQAAIPSAENPGDPDGEDGEVDAQNVNFLDSDSGATLRSLSLSSFDNDLCPTSSPCGRYDGSAAAAYAHTYYQGNGNYPNYFDDNCTNFVSQALRAGGFRFLRYNRAEDHGVTGPGSWWVDKLTSSPATWKSSQSWAVAPELYSHLTTLRLASEIPGPTRSFRPGDVLFYELHGHGIDHASIVTTVRAGKAWVAQSGAKRYERLYADQMQYISQHYQDFGGLRVVRPKYTAVNIPE